MKRKIEKFFGFFNSPPKEEKVKNKPEEKVKNKPEEKQAHIFAKKVKPDKEHAMKKVKDFDRGHLPSDAMRQFREEINQLIVQLNRTSDNNEKKNILQQIQNKITAVDYKYPPTLLASSSGYKEAHAALFKDIKKQMALIGIDSLLPPQAKASPLAEVVANMSPEKTEQLMAILIKGKTSTLNIELKNLYNSDDTSAEANSFRNLLKNHEIKYLGGGNSKNFSVTNINDNSIQVLKVDCRLDMPRNVEAHLREGLGSQFAPTYADRQVTFPDTNGRSISRTLLVTDYCTGGSVLEYRLEALNNEQLGKNATQIFEQMADVMLQIQQQGCMFPDAKLTNWLVNEEGKLILADTKSFVFVDAQGNYSNSLPGNEHTGLLQTSVFRPPELGGGSANADGVHAYILGKNLHSFLTGGFNTEHNGSNFDFSSDVFNSARGKELKALIIDLVKPDAASRMSVTAARDRLSNIIKNEVFFELEGLKFGPEDKTMDKFIADKKQQLDAVKNNPGERAKIIAEIKTTIAALKADAAANEVRSIIDNYRKNEGIFTIGMGTKADKIEQAMIKVPIAERAKLVDSSSSKEVMQALASHRYLGKRGDVYLTKKGEIDTDKSATTYKNFKARFIDQREKINANSADQSNVNAADEHKGMKLK